MNRRLGCLTGGGLLAAAVTLALLLAFFLARGGRMFSPGPLNAQGAELLGQVRSHAETGGRCQACHTSPWSKTTLSDRCLACHTSVAGQLQTGTGLHAAMRRQDAAFDCRDCHTEHRGPTAALTEVDVATFPHDQTAFPLTGKHAGIQCGECHKGGVFEGTDASCVSCHADPPFHRGVFGTACADCHTAVGWAPATFNLPHTFPIDHGEEGPVACRVCHADSVSAYTCYGCHEHNPAETAAKHAEEAPGDITNCVKCHPTGQEEEGEGED